MDAHPAGAGLQTVIFHLRDADAYIKFFICGTQMATNIYFISVATTLHNSAKISYTMPMSLSILSFCTCGESVGRSIVTGRGVWRGQI